MNPIYFYIIKNFRKHYQKRTKESKYRFKVDVEHYVKSFLFIILAVFSAAFGLKGFLLPNALLDGGITGVSLLVSIVSQVRLSLLIFLLNIPFMVLAYFHIGRVVALKSVLAIIALAIVIASIDFPVITDDKVLSPIFGGFFLGLGIGFAIRGGATIDGTELLAIYLSKKARFTIGEIILILNIIIFLAAAYILSIETAMYSILTYFAASKTVDFIVEGFEEYIGITIISEKSDLIRKMIIHTLRRGVTIYHGSKGYQEVLKENGKINIIFTVVTRLELNKIEREVEKIDPKAFMVMHQVKDTKGGIIKKLPLKRIHDE